MAVKELKSDSESRRMRDWLSPPDPSINHNKALEQRHPGTGRWFLDSHTFTDFKRGQVRSLWLHGIPGCGKTVLTSSVIEDFQGGPSVISPKLLYFYFDFNDVGKQTLESALRSLIWQQTSFSDDLPDELRQFYERCEKGRESLSARSLSETCKKMLHASGRVVIILDALDECKGRNRTCLLAWLTELISSAPQNTQVILTSRYEHDIMTALEASMPDNAKIPLRQVEIDTDIRKYIRERLHRGPELARWHLKPEVQEEIEVELMKKANGM